MPRYDPRSLSDFNTNKSLFLLYGVPAIILIVIFAAITLTVVLVLKNKKKTEKKAIDNTKNIKEDNLQEDI